MKLPEYKKEIFFTKSKFFKHVEALCKFYIIPLQQDLDGSKFVLLTFSVKSYINVIILMSPFICIVPSVLCQLDYFKIALEALIESYHAIDLKAMVIFPGLNFLPFSSFFMIRMASRQSWERIFAAEISTIQQF